MRSKNAREFLRKWINSNTAKIDLESAIYAVETAEQELCDKFAEDIHRIVETWDRSDKKLDDIHNKEVSDLQAENERLQSEIATLRAALEEANKQSLK